MIRDFGYLEVLALVGAVRWTLLLTAVAFMGSALVGAFLAILRNSRLLPLRWIAIAYFQAVQGIPLLVWLFILFFGVSMVGGNMSPWVAAALAFSIYGGAFLGEIWYGAVAAVPKAQWEAGSSLGFSTAQQYRYIIIPQSVRIAIPPTVGFLVQMIKSTSLASTIGFVELTRQAQLVSGATYSPLITYFIAAILYFLVCFPLTHFSRVLEKRIVHAGMK